MSNKDTKSKNIKHKALSDEGKARVRTASIKASKAASIKHAMKISSEAEKAAEKAAEKKADPSGQNTSENKGPDLIWSNDIIPVQEQEKRKDQKIRWGLLIPALIVLALLALFITASRAGWINSFLTPSGKIVSEPTSTQAMTEAQTTTRKEKPTPTRTTEEKETTTEFVPSYYVINVNLAYNVVTVYTRGEKLGDGYDPADPRDDEYALDPVIAFTCSPGVGGSTPTGTYYLQNRSDWCLMIGDVYTQYATRIVDDVMFHSVPYFTKNPGDLETYEYNILGYEASSACIRLNVRDASWIFFNCAEATEVNIFYNWDYYGPLDPEPIYRIPSDLDPLSKWDPTDIYSEGNPWLTYTASLTSDNVVLPYNSSVDSLLRALGPTDEYGHDLSEYFYTDGGYSLWSPGTYTTVGHIDIATLSFSFPITITITEEEATEEYYYYDEDGNYEDGYEGYEDGQEGYEDGYEEGIYENGGYEDEGYYENSYDDAY